MAPRENLTQEIEANITHERIDVRLPITDPWLMPLYHWNARARADFLTVLTACRCISNSPR